MTDEIIQSKMIELAKSICYEYHDISYLKKAMYCKIIHCERDGKNRKNYTNDSLATLGDTLLKFILTDFLFDKGLDKQKITEQKAKWEKNETLKNLSTDSGIFKYAYHDDCFFENAPRENQVRHSTHDVYVEAIIAAIYKDRGIEYCKIWTIEFFRKYRIIEKSIGNCT